MLALVVAFTLATSVSALFWLIIVPGRLNVAFLAFAFDWLPHHGLSDTPDTNRFRTTRNRVGMERLMTPALIYQNYHLVHHMHPLIPFYRYIAAWRRNEDAYLAEDVPLATAGGHELDVDEYRRPAPAPERPPRLSEPALGPLARVAARGPPPRAASGAARARRGSPARRAPS